MHFPSLEFFVWKLGSIYRFLQNLLNRLNFFPKTLANGKTVRYNKVNGEEMIRKMKKIAIIFLVFVFGFIFIACDKNETASLIISGDYKTNYYLNEEFSSEGLIVKYKVGDKEEVVSGYTISGFDSSDVGICKVTVTYKGVFATFSVNILSGVQTSTQLKIYDMPDLLKSSERYDIKVEGTSLFVYETLVNHGRSFTWVNSTAYASVASFDFMGRVHIEIDIKDDYVVEKASVHPLAYEVEVTVNDNKIEFDLDYPANYTIEINDPVPQPNNGSVIQEVIHLFANPIETDPITEEEAELDEDIIYIGPGVWKTDTIPLESGKTVYLAGGALVYGQFNAYGLSDITIRGRGIISGSIYPRQEASQRAIPLELQKCNGVYIEGIAFLDPAGWTIHAQETKNLEIDNIKIITARPNGDGISIQSCEDVVVKNSFVRTWDDSLVVKNTNNASTKNVTFSNNIVWTDLAQSMEIGYETYGAKIENVVFEDITVLHSYHKAVMSIHNADQAAISNIYFRDITIEDAQGVGDFWTETYDNYFIDMTIAFNVDWSKSQYERGTIKNVYFENIKVINEKKHGAANYDLLIRMNGFDANKNISNIYFTDVEFHGAPLTDVSVINTNNFVSDIQVLSSEKASGSGVYHYYELDLDDNYIVDKTVVPARVQDAIEVPAFAVSTAQPPYAGAKITGNFTVRATEGVSTNDWGGSATGNHHLTGYEVSNILLDDNTLFRAAPWKEGATRADYIAVSVIFDTAHKVGSIRLFGDENSMYFLMQNISVYAATNIKAETGLPVFSKKLNGENYEFSPSKNNYVDIRIQPGDYIAIQLRFYHYDSEVYARNPFLRYIEFYPASLTFGKTPYASPYEDVYNPEKLTDGDVTTYFESKKKLWPGWVAVDMGSVYNVRIINLHLPPLASWPNRTQEIEIKYSTSSETSITSNNWITLFDGPVDYYFDGAKGNMVSITLEEAIPMRSIIFIVTANSAPGGYGAQFSEISVYE
jgi:hypothetical protein